MGPRLGNTLFKKKKAKESTKEKTVEGGDTERGERENNEGCQEDQNFNVKKHGSVVELREGND